MSRKDMLGLLAWGSAKYCALQRLYTPPAIFSFRNRLSIAAGSHARQANSLAFVGCLLLHLSVNSLLGV